MEGFSFFVAGGDFIRIIVYNVVYFFHDDDVYIKPYTFCSFYSCYKFTYKCGYQTSFIDFTKLGERCDHPTLTRLTPFGWRKTLWFAWLDAPIPVEGWACGWVAASELVKIIGWFHLECRELIFLLNSDDFFREKCCWGSCWWDCGTWVQCWGRPSMAEIGFIGKVQTLIVGFLSISSLPRVPIFDQWNDDKAKMRSKK